MQLFFFSGFCLAAMPCEHCLMHPHIPWGDWGECGGKMGEDKGIGTSLINQPALKIYLING